MEQEGPEMAEDLYVMYDELGPVSYAYGEAWVQQALLMDDWKYPTPQEARDAWERFLRTGDRRKKDG